MINAQCLGCPASGRLHSRGAMLLVEFPEIERLGAQGESIAEVVERTISAALGATMRDVIVSRVDKRYAVCVPMQTREEEIAAALGRLAQAFAEPLFVNGRPLLLAPVAGVAQCRRDGEDAGELLRLAQGALERARRRGRLVEFCDELASERAHKAQVLRDSVWDALRELGQLHVFYQPIVDLNEGRVAMVEALVRWDHPRFGYLEPESFLDACRNAGAISAIDMWVLDASCRQLALWRRAGHNVRLSVNVNAEHVASVDFVTTVEQTLSRYRLPWDSLGLELTESEALAHLTDTQHNLQALRERGVTVAIDDFGTGHASLAYAVDLPVDSLKIDGSFIARCTDSPSHAAVTRSILWLAESLGWTSVAEGVETQEQLAFLQEAGCRFAQGFRFGHPMTANGVEREFLTLRSFR
jgi:EAL domain-containing protein (putative c-di-GMP-specific phosphodiesterase class I)